MPWKAGRAWQPCPVNLDFDLCGYSKGIIDVDSEVPNGALDFGMAKKQLYRAQIPSAAIDQGCFGAPEGMRSKKAWIEPNGADPLPDEPSLLPDRYRPVGLAAARKQEFAGSSAGLA